MDQHCEVSGGRRAAQPACAHIFYTSPTWTIVNQQQLPADCLPQIKKLRVVLGRAGIVGNPMIVTVALKNKDQKRVVPHFLVLG